MIYGLQKASLTKRASAYLLDIILLAILAVGCMYLCAVIFKVDSHQEKLQEYYDYYEEVYHVEFGLTQEDFDNMTEEELAHYNEVENILASDQDLIKEYNMVLNLVLISVFIGALVSTMVFEFVIPIILKNGQTVGKKVFALGLVRANCVKITNVQLFVRALFGKFLVETLIPLYYIVMILFGAVGQMGTIALIALGLTNIVLLFATKNHTPIHDALAFTVVCDLSEQKMFDNEEELIEAKKQAHLEETTRRDY